MQRRTLLVAAAYGALSPSARPASGPPYPARPIRLIVGYAHSAQRSSIARLVAQKVGEILGVSIVVDHRLGANGTIGVELTARAPAGGYTLLLAGGGPLTIALALDAGVRYDAQRDFVAIARIARVPLVPAVRSGLPVTTAAQLIGYAMTHPRELTYASTGASAQLALESLTAAEGLDIVYVPYKGAALAVFDVVTGRVRSPIS